MPHDLEPVDHDPFADEHQQLEPVEHEPFPEMRALEAVMMRVLRIEGGMADAVAEIRAMLNNLTMSVAHVHAANENLHRAIRAPKRIVRDEEGRPSGIEIDQGG